MADDHQKWYPVQQIERCEPELKHDFLVQLRDMSDPNVNLVLAVHDFNHPNTSTSTKAEIVLKWGVEQ